MQVIDDNRGDCSDETRCRKQSPEMLPSFSGRINCGLKLLPKHDLSHNQSNSISPSNNKIVSRFSRDEAILQKRKSIQASRDNSATKSTSKSYQAQLAT